LYDSRRNVRKEEEERRGKARLEMLERERSKSYSKV
jgi:hypothetical protein